MIPIKKCDSCQTELPLGSSKYSVRLEVTSEFDGFLPDEDFDREEFALESIFNEIDNISSEELEADVHVEVELTICRDCKNRLLEQLEDFSETNILSKSKQRPSLH